MKGVVCVDALHTLRGSVCKCSIIMQGRESVFVESVTYLCEGLIYEEIVIYIMCALRSGVVTI